MAAANAVNAANTAPTTVEDKGGVLTITVNHGGKAFAPREWTKDGESKVSDYQLISEIGSRFGTLDLPSGLSVALLVTRKSKAPRKSSGNLTIK